MKPSAAPEGTELVYVDLPREPANTNAGEPPDGVDRNHRNYGRVTVKADGMEVRCKDGAFIATLATTRVVTPQPRMTRRQLRAWAAKAGNRAPTLSQGLRQRWAEQRLAEAEARAIGTQSAGIATVDDAEAYCDAMRERNRAKAKRRARRGK